MGHCAVFVTVAPVCTENAIRIDWLKESTNVIARRSRCYWGFDFVHDFLGTYARPGRTHRVVVSRGARSQPACIAGCKVIFWEVYEAQREAEPLANLLELLRRWRLLRGEGQHLVLARPWGGQVTEPSHSHATR